MFYSQLERKNFFDFTWDFLPNFSKNVFRKPFHFYLKKFRRKSSGKIFDIQTFWEPYLKIAILKRNPRAVLSRYLSHLPWRAVPPCKSVWCLWTSPIFGCVILHTWWLLLLLRCLMSEPPEPETCGETSWHVGRHRDMWGDIVTWLDVMTAVNNPRIQFSRRPGWVRPHLVTPEPLSLWSEILSEPEPVRAVMRRRPGPGADNHLNALPIPGPVSLVADKIFSQLSGFSF